VKGRILIVDDEKHQRDILQLILESEGYEGVSARNGRHALQALREQPFDVVLTDLKMPDMSGIELLTALLKAQPGLCVILMTAHGSIVSAVDAMLKGAFDYLTKPLEKDELLVVLGKGMERSRLVRENSLLKEQLRDRFRLESIIGTHGAMQDVFRIVHKVAASTSTVLIYGESGTGKELVARSIHLRSRRAGRAFVSINCGALTDTLLESELFGHKRGSFSGAVATRMGLFEAADGGTLFLDEIGNLPMEAQRMLLLALEDGRVTRLGETAPRRTDSTSSRAPFVNPLKAPFSQQPPGQGTNFGDRLHRPFRPKEAIPAVKRSALAGTALKVVRRHQRSHIKSRAITAAGKQWKSELIAGRVIVTRQENNHRPFLPSFGAAVKPSMNDVVFREFAGAGSGKAEMDRSVEFDLCRLTVSGNEVRTFQKSKGFLQPPVTFIGRHHQCHYLNSRPVHQFCQRRNHTLCKLRNSAAITRRNSVMKVESRPKRAEVGFDACLGPGGNALILHESVRADRRNRHGQIHRGTSAARTGRAGD
jgi:CheY-like chemotaxis protein